MNEDLRCVLPENEAVTRREFVATTLTAGLALAVQPLSAQTITTDTAGLVAGDIKIPTSDGEVPGYRAMPATGSSFPVVLVVQEIFGLHEHIKDICRRFAKNGHLAVAVDQFARQGDVSHMENFSDIISKVVSKVPDAQVMSDLDAAVGYAAKNKGNTQKLGITGFCWGGRIVWLYGAHNPQVKAGVAWYGRLAGDPTPMTPKNPIDVAATVKTPVLALFGGKDQGIPPDSIERMRKALKEAGNPSEMITYPEAPHGFFADYRTSYRKDDAADGWKRLQAWFKQHGAA